MVHTKIAIQPKTKRSDRPLVQTIGVLMSLVCLGGCADKAKPAFSDCVLMELRDEILEARDACSAAITADPTSEAGKAAAQKLEEMKPRIEEAEREQAEAERLRLKAEREREEARVAELRRKVSYESRGIDSDCQSNGKPPRGRTYSGGTYRQNEEVALADGCVHQFPTYRHSKTLLFNDYCCP